MRVLKDGVLVTIGTDLCVRVCNIYIYIYFVKKSINLADISGKLLPIP